MAKKHFKAESKRLLDLMIHSIYTNPDIFLREIISNASDASDKLHYLSLTDETARKQMGELSIDILPDSEARTLTVRDHGIGMTKEELENNLGTICKSGSLQFKEDMSEEEQKEAVHIIGQFGVGFYSAFMVSDRVTVITRSYKDETGYRWESDGADGYTVSECETDGVGTTVIMHLRPDNENEKFSDYLSEYKLRNLIKTYSDYIRYPIRMPVQKTREVGEGEEKKTETYTEPQTINSMVPVWKKQKSELKEEETDEFYKNTFHDFAKPLFTIRVSAEGVVSYDALLFIPEKAPYDYYTKEYETGLKLYNSGVMIMEKCRELVPEYFRFVRGVVDTQDLSLNISREMLQKDANLQIIAKNVEKKIRSELKNVMEKDREKYEKFYRAFGLQLKYGTVSNYGMNKEKLKDLLLFYSMNQKKLISLAEYTAQMPEDQKYIYYACGDDVARIRELPQAEPLKAKGYDMLCLSDEVDEFVMNILQNEGGKEFVSINSEKADLLDDEAKKAAEQTQENEKELLAFVKDTLGISDAVISKKLKTHPVCLTAKEGVTLEMEKYFASMPGADANRMKAERVLELNPNHKAFAALKKAYETDRERAGTLCEILYDQALLIAGLPIENPSDYAEKVCSLFE